MYVCVHLNWNVHLKPIANQIAIYNNYTRHEINRGMHSSIGAVNAFDHSNTYEWSTKYGKKGKEDNSET